MHQRPLLGTAGRSGLICHPTLIMLPDCWHTDGPAMRPGAHKLVFDDGPCLQVQALSQAVLSEQAVIVSFARQSMTRRFGALPGEVVAQIAAATSAQLEQWGDRVLDAGSLEEVFGR